MLVGRKAREADKLESNSPTDTSSKGRVWDEKVHWHSFCGEHGGRMFFNLNAWMIDGIFTSGPKLVP